MKKLLVLMVVALLALALVACGGEGATTTAAPTTTKAPVDTTVAPADTTATPSETTATPETTTPVTTPAVTTPAVTTPAVTTPVVTTPAVTTPETTTPETTTPETTTPAPEGFPTDGLKELTVDLDSVVFSNEYWSANPPKDAFDGNTVTTKLGTNKAASLPVTLEFSLTEAATVTWYTFWTGNDTIPNYAGRNPKSWVMYGKVNGEWVVLSEVTESGMVDEWATPYSYAVTNPQECKDYKIVFETSSDIFQLNEIELYKNDATVKAPVLAAVMDGAEVCFPHATGYNADVYRIRTTIKADKGQFDQTSIAQLTKDGAYAWVKDVTNGGEYVRYEVSAIETARWCDINFILDGFTPVAGVEYEFAFFFMSGDAAVTPNALHVLHFFFTIPQ